MRQSSDQSGVTLLELIVVLSLFSLIATLTFQGLALTISNKVTIKQEVERQSEIAFTHRALSSAVESMAPINGSQIALTFYLHSSDSGYYPQANTQTFLIQDRSLKVILDSGSDETYLINDLDSAGFYFVSNGRRLYEWSRNENPDMLGFEWARHGKTHNWLFGIR
ncbi:MAG: type II secretion system GspH family protein [Gammaproteobacteria bacterium]|nr:type II secretion system GspH family protein [Gammaproteobacteria bacterium]